jgi:dTDP-4-dehydrorhamnose 3,5-epimerase-like enzyme
MENHMLANPSFGSTRGMHFQAKPSAAGGTLVFGGSRGLKRR